MFKKPVIIVGVASLFFALGFINVPKAIYQSNKSNGLIGEAPSIAVEGNKVHMAMASGDSIFYSFSEDKGQQFAAPSLVAVLKGLVCVGSRGPQILCSNGQLLIAAPDTAGNFTTYIKKSTGSSWGKSSRINDVPNIAKEGFLSLGAGKDGHLFAVWLDLRNGRKNNLYCARSMDRGKSWMKNQLVYKSPDGSVCECCKPTAAVKDDQVAVLFRNNLKGNRDLYLIQSNNGGATFGPAQKLGEGSWQLSGCPMDGGGIMIANNKTIETVWRREGDIYTSQPGRPEILIGKGKQCAIAGTTEDFYISFINAGKVYCRKPDGKIIELGPGGSYPKIVAIDKSTVFCAWEFENKIYKVLL